VRRRIKRLLELDRSIGRNLRSKDAEEANFAFFSEEAPGTRAAIDNVHALAAHPMVEVLRHRPMFPGPLKS
jgi:hypothetical protein